MEKAVPIELQDIDKLTVPASPEVVAPLMWIESMSMYFPNPDQEASLNMRYYPMTTERKVIRNVGGIDQGKSFNSSTLYADMGDCPELAFAFNAVITAVPVLGKVYADRKAAEVEAAIAAEQARTAAALAAEEARHKAELERLK